MRNEPPFPSAYGAVRRGVKSACERQAARNVATRSSGYDCGVAFQQIKSISAGNQVRFSGRSARPPPEAPLAVSLRRTVSEDRPVAPDENMIGTDETGDEADETRFRRHDVDVEDDAAFRLMHRRKSTAVRRTDQSAPMPRRQSAVMTTRSSGNSSKTPRCHRRYRSGRVDGASAQAGTKPAKTGQLVRKWLGVDWMQEDRDVEFGSNPQDRPGLRRVNQLGPLCAVEKQTGQIKIKYGASRFDSGRLPPVKRHRRQCEQTVGMAQSRGCEIVVQPAADVPEIGIGVRPPWTAPHQSRAAQSRLRLSIGNLVQSISENFRSQMRAHRRSSGRSGAR